MFYVCNNIIRYQVTEEAADDVDTKTYKQKYPLLKKRKKNYERRMQ